MVRTRFVRLPFLAAVIGAALLAMGAGQANATPGCVETINPAGNPAVGDNGTNGILPWGTPDPYNGDAVPGGKHTSPGVKGNGPINSDGFYVVYGRLFSGNTPIAPPASIRIPGEDPMWWPSTWIKYTQWGNKNIVITDNIGGPKSAIQYHIQAPDDLYVGASKANGGLFCGVPKPPF
jgi:hypothetical protein